MNNQNELLLEVAGFMPVSVVPPEYWCGHLPFAAWLIRVAEPKVFVELGTHSGNSYFSFCQAVSKANLDTKCYAVDTWQGDMHTGRYSTNVFEEVNDHNKLYYEKFSSLMRMTFDNALSHFSDGSIDLLHIDGLHTYEGVKHDFDTWRPKLAPGAIVLFHDTHVHDHGFGVWKFWEELHSQYPNNMEFEHSCGLGVLQIDGATAGNKMAWLDSNSIEHPKIKSYFSALGERQIERVELRHIKDKVEDLRKAVVKRDRQIANLQLLSSDLRDEVKNIRSSTSWRITKPLRALSEYGQRFLGGVRFYQNYRQRHPGMGGLRRLLTQCFNVSSQGGIKSLASRVFLYKHFNMKGSVSVESVAKQFKARRIDLLHIYLQKGLLLKPIIIFDHNGGGGANTYSTELVKSIHSNGGMTLRVYCFEAVWLVELGDVDDNLLFYTSSINNLFEFFSKLQSDSIIINSVYGYPDIRMAISMIIDLASSKKAALEVKIHDFYAICPSPHLSDFEGKYCGVPQLQEVCISCLKQNIGWYHSWYPQENRPTDVAQWRKPFAELFEAATAITFFDQSSVEILGRAFDLDANKLKVRPHHINYFPDNCHVRVVEPLHIGVLGTLSSIKGGTVVNELAKYITKHGLGIPITVVGQSLFPTMSDVKVLGPYESKNLHEIVNNEGINVILMPSIVPETFSYTISEAMKMSLPIVAFDIGAQGRRVDQYIRGKVIPLDSPTQVILTAIQSVLKEALEMKI
ncbi:MAG: class I SAM-dependent methyltransferase [Bacteroidota bacterium]